MEINKQTFVNGFNYCKDNPWTWKTGLVLLVAIIAYNLIMFAGEIHFTNTYNTKVKLCTAKVDLLKANRDKMAKILAGKASAALVGTEKFDEIYNKMMSGRYGDKKGGALMSWIQESHPNADFIKLFEQYSTAIEANRNEYFTHQSVARDIQREIETLVVNWPGRIWLEGKEIPEVPIIVSSETNKVFEEGVDDFVDPLKQ